MDRRLEYEKGPTAEDESADESDDDAETGGSAGSVSLEDAPWKIGPLAGLGAFAVVYAVTFQFVNATYGLAPTREDVAVGRATMAGLLTLGSHGASLTEVETRWYGYGLEALVLFAPLLVTIVALGTLVATGYVVTRYVDPDSARETVVTAACIVPGYFLAAVLTAQVATYTPEIPEGAPDGAEEEIGTLAVSLDATFVLVFVLVPLSAALAGALLANRALLGGSTEEDRRTASDGETRADTADSGASDG